MDFVGVVTFDRATTSKEVWKSVKEIALGSIISHLFVVLLFKFVVYFSMKSKQRISPTEDGKNNYCNTQNMGTFSIKNLQFLKINFYKNFINKVQ